MKLIFKKILSTFFLFTFIFYSAGALSFSTGKNKLKDDCMMRKSCSCCEMQKGKEVCCINHSIRFSISINLPCHHSNFYGINFKFDPAVGLLSANRISDEQNYKYILLNFNRYYQTEIIPLIKPPRT